MRDPEQARHLMPAYIARYNELAAANQYHYNSSFKGYLGEFATERDEDQAIYECQQLRQLDSDREKIDAALAEGFVPITFQDVTAPIRGSVIEHSFYVGGTGFKRFDDVRLIRVGVNSLAVLPPRARTRGHFLHGAGVMVKTA